jgi:hypothetical protein
MERVLSPERLSGIHPATGALQLPKETPSGD